MDFAEPNLICPLQTASTAVDFSTGALSGSVAESVKRLGDLQGVFADEAARARMPQDAVVYTVQVHKAEREGVPGGLCFGTSFIHPGVVGEEFHMTRGHFHDRPEAAEYYWCLQGEGILLLMDRNRHCTAMRMTPGSLHYIPGHTAHRLVNTGSAV
ncbi:MAG TPA: glucose-6-phosphate isomerase family protein, partial [Clostridia bacterium]|nr:glucose-6-phosphate isomerase family protein [Clostridia bacterium]